MCMYFMQYPSAATTVAYSENGQLLAVGHRNGQIQIWKGRAVLHYTVQVYTSICTTVTVCISTVLIPHVCISLISAYTGLTSL